ncbi:MAG: tetratricopeptide repeat protein [Patescibacteria group bacterium]|nr:tetratricopeptide repeat protein [Patescibacteria group bacterium]
MRKFPIFVLILILIIVAFAIGMRAQNIAPESLFGEKAGLYVRQVLDFAGWFDKESAEDAENTETGAVLTETGVISTSTGTVAETGTGVTATGSEVVLSDAASSSGAQTMTGAVGSGNNIVPTENSEKLDVAATKQQITKALDDKDYKSALDLAEKLVAADAADVDFYAPIMFGAITKIDEYDRALTLAKKLANENPKNARAWNYVGWAALSANKLDEAQVALEVAVGLDEKRADIHLNMGDLYVAQSEVETAKLHYNQAIELDGPDGSITSLAKSKLAKIAQ